MSKPDRFLPLWGLNFKGYKRPLRLTGIAVFLFLLGIHLDHISQPPCM